MSDDAERIARGREVLERMGWDNAKGPLAGDIDQEFWDFSLANMFGEVWARPGLSLRERALVSLAALIALDRYPGIQTHFRNAHKLDISDEQVREVIIQVMYYAGWPVGAHAIREFNRIVAARDKAAADKV